LETGIRGEDMENFTVYNEEIDELPVIIDLPHSGTFIKITN
jgi:N-formylglutamate amidohydrolase